MHRSHCRILNDSLQLSPSQTQADARKRGSSRSVACTPSILLTSRCSIEPASRPAFCSYTSLLQCGKPPGFMAQPPPTMWHCTAPEPSEEPSKGQEVGAGANPETWPGCTSVSWCTDRRRAMP